jgi:diguanylate cyclase (GGDEF)-like protein/PAS domain S-box-containing protein
LVIATGLGLMAGVGFGHLPDALLDRLSADQLIRVGAAVAAAWIVYRGWQQGRGRAREVRTWLLIAMGLWLASEIVRLTSPFIGARLQPGLDLTVVGLAVTAAGAYFSAAHGRLRRSEEIALYLDAATIFAAVSAVVLVAGATLAGHQSEAIRLTLVSHAAFFLATVGATVILDLATRVPVRLKGPYGVLVGLLLASIGYVGLLVATEPGRAGTLLHISIAAGAVMAAYGGANWTTDEEGRPGFVAVADRLRNALPTAAVALTPILILVMGVAPIGDLGALKLPATLATGAVLLFAVARQTVLLNDRERSMHLERRLRDELAAAEAQFRAVVERVPGVVYVADAGEEGRWHYVSAAIREMLGFTAEEWLADPEIWKRQLHPADRTRMLLAERSGDHTYFGSRWEYRMLARDGREVWVLDDEAVISRDADCRPARVQGILLDITERKRLEEQLRHQALHDPLTGLPNRVLFVDRVEHALTRRRGTVRAAVLFLDIDDFKTINDSLGHAAGDELLVGVAERIRMALRPEDTACRMGGDEFAILLEDVEVDQAEHSAARILDALRPPFQLGPREVMLRASVGLAARRGMQVTAEDLLRDADTAMYAAKAAGKGRVVRFELGMAQPVMRRLEMRTALELALSREELFLEYQPIIDLLTDEAVGAEALVRWNHPQLGRVMPGDFIPLAEEIGLIGEIGDWVLQTACAELAAWRAAAPTRPIVVSVNVSAFQLGSGELIRQVERALATTGTRPEWLILELTESTLAAATDRVDEELHGIRELGVRIALDDFGSGFSSLDYLGRFEVDLLKIDRSLVARVDLEPQRQAVLRAVATVAAQLGLSTIVEGIEREEQRRVVMNLGFRRAQGFLFSHPVSLTEALDPRAIDAA